MIIRVKNSEALRQNGVKYLYYLTPTENLPSILKEGIFSRNEISKWKNFSDHSNQEVQIRRKYKNLHSKVPLFFNTRNAMTYCWESKNIKFVILALSVKLTDHYSCTITDKNAAADFANFYKLTPENIEKIRLNEIITIRSFYNNYSKKQRVAAELLVDTGHIAPKWIKKIFVKPHHYYHVINKLKRANAKREIIKDDGRLYFN